MSFSQVLSNSNGQLTVTSDAPNPFGGGTVAPYQLQPGEIFTHPDESVDRQGSNGVDLAPGFSAGPQATQHFTADEWRAIAAKGDGGFLGGFGSILLPIALSIAFPGAGAALADTFGGELVGDIASRAVIGGASSLITGGDVGKGVLGGVVAGATNGLVPEGTDPLVRGAVVGGTTAAATGGDPITGALAGAAGNSTDNPVINTIARTAVGAALRPTVNSNGFSSVLSPTTQTQQPLGTDSSAVGAGGMIGWLKPKGTKNG